MIGRIQSITCKTKPIATWSHAFSRAWRRLRVLTTSFPRSLFFPPLFNRFWREEETLGTRLVYLLWLSTGSLCCSRLLWLAIVIALVSVLRHSVENRQNQRNRICPITTDANNHEPIRARSNSMLPAQQARENAYTGNPSHNWFDNTLTLDSQWKAALQCTSRFYLLLMVVVCFFQAEENTPFITDQENIQDTWILDRAKIFK